MHKRTVSLAVLFLLLTNMLVFSSAVRTVNAAGTIYINADGSISPSTAPIYTADNITYILTGNIRVYLNGIVVERDNIVVDGAGYTLQGNGSWSGIGLNLAAANHVTIENTNIEEFDSGIFLGLSSNNTISGNNITNNGVGIMLESCSNNSISENNITNNEFYNGVGIMLESCSNNSISENNITNNEFSLVFSLNNSISGNTFINGSLYVADSYQNSVDNNTVNGKPLIYLEGVSNTTVDDDAGQVVLVNCEDMMVEGCSFSKTNFAIELWGTSNSTISGNNITANTEDGIGLYFSSGNNVSGNSITGKFGTSGIILDFSNYTTISGNSITNNRYGIYIASSSSTSASGNDITNNGYGFWLASSPSNSISGNNITNNGGYGIGLESSSNNSISGNNIINSNDGIRIGSSSNNSISGNDITNNVYGIMVDSSSGNSISGNDITYNWEGIEFDFSSGNTVSGNDITYNDEGIEVASSNNKFYHNNCVYNTAQVHNLYNSTNIWDDGYPLCGNYWSDYGGVDSYSGSYQNLTGSDGIGDTPYVINDYNRDNYPLMNPYPIYPMNHSAAHDIGITNVATSKNVVFQGFNASTNVMIFNYGNGTEAVNVTIYANQTVLGEQYSVNVTSGNFALVAFTWNTTGFATGNYTLSVYAWPVPGETNTADNNFTGSWVIVSLVGDITGPNGWPDDKCDMRDIGLVARNFGLTVPPAPANCDLTGPTAGVPDDKIDMRDIGLVARHFGETGP